MKLTDLKPGDVIEADAGFTCMGAGPKTVMADPDVPDDGRGAALYVECSSGKHFLDGQVEDASGTLIGLSR